MSEGLFWLLMSVLGLLAAQYAAAGDLARQLAHPQEEAEDDASMEATDDDSWSILEEHQFSEQDLKCFEPDFNIDGSPMVGGLDVHGNAYGVTSDW